MKDPFLDSAEFDLTRLPEIASNLLVETNASPRLVAHCRLVYDVMVKLLDAVTRTWPTLSFDREAVLFGAATHDIGKALHLRELHQPGAAHEVDGRRLLVERGFDDRLARFAETHAAWKRGDECTIEDLLVALADTCWKGKRSESLENLLCDQLELRLEKDRWEIFLTLDALIDEVAAVADKRLEWQSRY